MAHDPGLAPIELTGSALGDALAALAAAAAAVRRRLGPIGSPWQIMAVITHGRLLAALHSG